MILYRFYHRKSPSNHHLGDFFGELFPSNLSKSRYIYIYASGKNHPIKLCKNRWLWVSILNFRGQFILYISIFMLTLVSWWDEIHQMFNPFQAVNKHDGKLRGLLPKGVALDSYEANCNLNSGCNHYSNKFRFWCIAVDWFFWGSTTIPWNTRKKRGSFSRLLHGCLGGPFRHFVKCLPRHRPEGSLHVMEPKDDSWMGEWKSWSHGGQTEGK